MTFHLATNQQSLTREEQHVAAWSQVLIAQHVQLRAEIDQIAELMAPATFCVYQLDAKLRRLIKGVKTHLELEHAFIAPALSQLHITPRQEHRLTEGYDALLSDCEATSKLVHSLKFSLHNQPLHRTEIKKIERMLDDIGDRLADEDIAYGMIKILEEQYA